MLYSSERKILLLCTCSLFNRSNDNDENELKRGCHLNVN